MTVLIRPITQDDFAEWSRLWTGYLDYYKSELSESVYQTTFKRLLNDEFYDPRGFIAEIEGKPVGLVHYMFQRHCWREEHVIYLQDLFADKDVRGRGVGRALIEAVYAIGDRETAPTVFWLTEDFNTTAHKLYDMVGKRTPFIKYQR